jgi:co-chaperonin GroES (HSP10)
MSPQTAKAQAAPRLVPVARPDPAKQLILDELGDISAVKVPLNRILLAIYKAPEKTPGGIIRPGMVQKEDIWQGNSGLVVKMGPHAYEQTDNMDYEWADDDRCHVGDWVMFRRADGLRVNVNNRECLLLESEKGIKMVIPHPDIIWERGT